MSTPAAPDILHPVNIRLALATVTLPFMLAACDGGGTSIIERIDETQAPRVEVAGITLEPRPDGAVSGRQLPPPPTMFEPWDGQSAVVYDIDGRTATAFGRGTLGSFDPSGGLYAWIAEPAAGGAGELRVLDLRTNEQRVIGAGSNARFVNETQILVSPVGVTPGALIDVFTLERTTADDEQPAMANSEEIETPSGYFLRRPSRDEPFTLVNPATGNVLLRFDAMAAQPAGEDAILIATRPVDINAANNAQGAPAEDTANLFLIDIESGAATFVASAVGLFDGPTFSLPMAASQNFVAWTPFYCGIAAQGRTRIYDRVTGAITELDASLFVGFTPDGLLTADFGFGPERLIEPRTLEYVAVVPGGDDIAWSDDYKYAAHGLTFGGHDGHCP